MQSGVLSALDARGFADLTAQLKVARPFLIHLFLNELAHARDDNATERDCDEWGVFAVGCLYRLDDAVKNREAFLIGNEFAHIHNPPIGNMHLTLPNPLRELAMVKRWVLPHPLAGKQGFTPDNVFAFAPRNESEVAVVKLLLSASHAYALGRMSMS